MKKINMGIAAQDSRIFLACYTVPASDILAHSLPWNELLKMKLESPCQIYRSRFCQHFFRLFWYQDQRPRGWNGSVSSIAMDERRIHISVNSYRSRSSHCRTGNVLISKRRRNFNESSAVLDPLLQACVLWILRRLCLPHKSTEG